MTQDALYSIFLNHPSVQTDTRHLKPGDLFFALKGPTFNGNEFAKQAIDSGAAFAIIDETKFSVEGRTILVDNVLISLQQLAKKHREQFTIPFIAITGSNGKTTTKELIHSVLSTQFKTYTTEGNLNNHIGVPLTILKIRKDAQMAVIEMGANHLKEIAFYCEIALPTHGLITNCGKAHLEGFGSEEGVRKGKGELYDHLRRNKGTAFVMKDYDYLVEMSKGIEEVITYGTGNAEIAGIPEKGNHYLTVHFSKGLAGSVKTKLVGDYNLPNVLASVAIGKYFKVSDPQIVSAIEFYEPANSRSQFMKKGSNEIILDAYNANPSSMKAAIENFAGLEGQNKILALGAMAELGENSQQEHMDIISEIKKHPWKEVILVGGDFLKTNSPYRKFQTSAEAGEWFRHEKIKDARLLIKGSRSIQMEKILEFI